MKECFCSHFLYEYRKTERNWRTISLASHCSEHNCNLVRLDPAGAGTLSSLPLAQNLIEIQRGLTTSSTSHICAVTTRNISKWEKITVLWINALSIIFIMVDRKKLKNPNGLILGTPVGKIYLLHRENSKCISVYGR